MRSEKIKEGRKETAAERVEKKVRSKLTAYEWRLLKKRLEEIEVRKGLRSKFSAFQHEFRRQLSTFITGAFAFVAALLWRDAIKSFIERYREFIVEWIPLRDEWFIQFYTAFAVTIIAVVAIVLISRYLKPSKK